MYKKYKRLSIKYIFKSGRKSRISSGNSFPKEFFYCYFDLLQKKLDVDFIEEIDLGIPKKVNLFTRFLNKLSRILLDFPLMHSKKLLEWKNIKLLNKSSIIIVTTKSLGLSLGFLRLLRIVKKPVIFIVMGLLSNESNFFKRNFYKLLLNKIKIVSISKNEKKFLESKIFNKPISYIPFGIDKDFWHPLDIKLKNQRYILAIGNDYNRDWDTLINAWEDYYPDLKIVTSIPIKTNKKNILIKKSSWGEEYISDKEIRNLYINSLFVIIPLKETMQPSGQSCCLQAMACGAPVVMTKINGSWDDTHLINRKNLLLIRPRSEVDLKNSIIELLNNKKLQKELSKNGRKLVEKHFNTSVMTYHLEKIIRELCIQESEI